MATRHTASQILIGTGCEARVSPPLAQAIGFPSANQPGGNALFLWCACAEAPASARDRRGRCGSAQLYAPAQCGAGGGAGARPESPEVRGGGGGAGSGTGGCPGSCRGRAAQRPGSLSPEGRPQAWEGRCPGAVTAKPLPGASVPAYGSASLRAPGGSAGIVLLGLLDAWANRCGCLGQVFGKSCFKTQFNWLSRACGAVSLLCWHRRVQLPVSFPVTLPAGPFCNCLKTAR